MVFRFSCGCRYLTLSLPFSLNSQYEKNEKWKTTRTLEHFRQMNSICGFYLNVIWVNIDKVERWQKKGKEYERKMKIAAGNHQPHLCLTGPSVEAKFFFCFFSFHPVAQCRLVARKSIVVVPFGHLKQKITNYIISASKNDEKKTMNLFVCVKFAPIRDSLIASIWIVYFGNEYCVCTHSVCFEFSFLFFSLFCSRQIVSRRNDWTFYSSPEHYFVISKYKPSNREQQQKLFICNATDWNNTFRFIQQSHMLWAKKKIISKNRQYVRV